ncbi:hypothetical protein [Streptomyces lichenis]|uniref:Flp pilus assembly protein RcpC/CpaB domain-containing protein n=1 Tax=Streptomyces lichenis TaxID=2306967 RepID=A0ABT0I7X1_9ACTN|nr:hypothetical protein [Streptomyces lichenis]MCK8677421.1 hypothetical protein [Streptomyces lichenis]
MGPPPRRKRGGMVALLVIGGLVLLGCLGYGVKMIASGVGGGDSAKRGSSDGGSSSRDSSRGGSSGGGSSNAFPAAEYKLTVPKTLLDGEYTLLQDMSESEGSKLTQESTSTTRADGAAIGQYTAQGASGGKVVVLSGFYGQVKRPDQERGSVLRGAATAENARVEQPAQDVTPAGADTTVECAVLSAAGAGAGQRVLFPMCAWGDENTVAGVAFMDTARLDGKAGDFDLAQAAKDTLKIRTETRTPIS